ncbi:MAG: TetR/AcrR family transcriptional regulator [Acidobacteriota bacterium]
MRSKIEASAVALFQSEGYAAVSMRRLAKDVGCSPMTLYSYFDSKIDILRTLWAQVFEELFAGLQPVLDSSDEPALRLERLAHGYVQYWVDHPEHYRMVFLSEGVSQPDVDVFLDSTEVAQRFSAFYELLGAAGEKGPSETKTSGDYLIAALHGIVHCRITMSGYPWSSVEDLVALAVTSTKR